MIWGFIATESPSGKQGVEPRIPRLEISVSDWITPLGIRSGFEHVRTESSCSLRS